MMAIQVMEMDEVAIKCGDESIKMVIFQIININNTFLTQLISLAIECSLYENLKYNIFIKYFKQYF